MGRYLAPMFLWMLAPLAVASVPCADVPTQVSAAWAAYNEAELERAKEALTTAYASLECQDKVVSSDVLLELYRLDGLVSLTQEDRKGAVYATIRAVAVDHQWAEPPPEYGPELAELYQVWAGRLGETLIHVTVTDGGTIWLDGTTVDRDNPRSVVQGEHLLQVQGINGLRSEVRELSVDQAIVTGIPLPGGQPPPQPPAPGGPPGDPAGVEPIEPVGPVVERQRRRPAWLLGTGGALLAAGGSALALGWQQERAFVNNPYDDDRYYRCTRQHVCYADARALTIEEDAQRIRTTYLVGYGAVGLGAAILGAGLVGLPVRTDGRTVSLHLDW